MPVRRLSRVAPSAIRPMALKLRHPLQTTVTHLDIDERVPEQWVPPILVDEFEEMED